MDGQIVERWTGVFLCEEMVKQIHGGMCKWTDGQLIGGTDGWKHIEGMNGWMDRWMDGWLGGWMNGQMDG